MILTCYALVLRMPDEGDLVQGIYGALDRTIDLALERPNTTSPHFWVIIQFTLNGKPCDGKEVWSEREHRLGLQ